jgi:HSP20 family protein
MDRLRREMNRVFAGTPARAVWQSEPCYPAMNVWLSEDGAVATAELPGFVAEDIDISVVDNALTLKGHREADPLQEGETYHRRERSCGKFERSFQLPFPVESGKVEATFERGVLNISLPRAEADKPKRITIKAG